MSERTSIIWMNVTTSARWQRPPVGIVRVERELCSELAKIFGADFKQCIWQDGRFIEWLPTSEDNSLQENKIMQVTQMGKQELPSIFPILAKRQALISLAQSLLSLMPNKLRPYFNRVLYALRPFVLRILSSDRFRRVLSKVSRKDILGGKGTTSPLGKRVGFCELFSPGDVLISIGLDWDYPYYKEFYRLRKNNGVKIVTCCYDLIPVYYPQYCVSNVANIFTSYFLEIADGSDLVLCISKRSEQDFKVLMDRTGGAQPVTQVIPMGDNVPQALGGQASSTVEAVCGDAFILFVSTIERRKNHEVLYRAYHLLCREGFKDKLPKLVLVGMQGWGVDELMKDIELDPLTQGMIVRLNHVSDTELRLLYEKAKFCVFPSLYEGWGLPVGEALSMGKAVISSDRGSLPEVGGALVRYVDPWSPRAWADEIYRMATDDLWRQQWEENAKHKYRIRYWSDTALAVKHGLDQFKKL